MPGLPIRTGYRDSRRTSFEGYLKVIGLFF